MNNLLTPINLDSGLKEEVLIAPVSWFTATGIKKPLAGETVITENHVFVANKFFLKFALAPEKNKLESKTFGDKGFSKFKNDLTIVLPGSYAAAHASVAALLNVGLIVLIKDTNCSADFYYQLGSACNPAYLTADFSTGTTIDGIKAYTAIISDNSEAVITYTGTVQTQIPIITLYDLSTAASYNSGYPTFVQNTQGKTIGFAQNQAEYVSIFNANPAIVGQEISAGATQYEFTSVGAVNVINLTAMVVPNIVGWYDVTDDTKVTVNGSNAITSIANKLGAAPALTSTGGAYPVRQTTGGFNGLKYAKIVSTSEIYANHSIAGTELTMVVCYKPNTCANNSIPINLNGSGNSGIKVVNRQGRQTIALMGIGTRETRPRTMTSDWKFACFQWSNTAGISTIAKINSEPFDDYSYERATTGVLPLYAQTRVAIGWRASQTIDFDISEVIYINKTLTDLEHKVLQEFLSLKYNPTPINKIGVFGDSVSYGAEAPPYETNGFAYLFGNNKNMYVDTFAYPGGKVFEAWRYVGSPVGGSNSEDVATANGIDFIDKIEKLNGKDLRNYQYWLIAYNYNDTWAQSNATYADAWILRYKALVQNLISRGVAANKIIIGTGPYHSSRTATQSIFDTRVSNMCTELGCVYVDYTTATLNAGGNTNMVDVAHPNNNGHTAMANAVIAVI